MVTDVVGLLLLRVAAVVNGGAADPLQHGY
jgi:hypothetical protein